MAKEHGIEIFTHTEPGYATLMRYGAWRVAVLNNNEHTTPEGIPHLQKHDLTDEVFVLLEGRCVLLSAGTDSLPGAIGAVVLEPGKVYNVPRGTWHSHVLEPGTSVLIVENEDTDDANSPIAALTQAQRAQIATLCAAALAK